MSLEAFVCKASDCEPKAEPAAPVRNRSFREELLALWTVVKFCQSFPRGMRKIKDLVVLCNYSNTAHTRRRRKPMDVEKMVDDWKAVIVALCVSHDKDAVDKAEYEMDALLKPILNAPIDELRAFYSGLTVALRKDSAVPFFIWSMFECWGKVIIEKCGNEAAVVRLKKKLAKQVAELAKPHIERDMVQAMVGALMWRDPETLEAIRDDLEAGAKPRLRGKESCLFLVTNRKGHERQVML